MNWETIKFIYRNVLIYKYKIEYLGENKYKIIRCFDNGQKFWEIGYENYERHGKSIGWTCYGSELYNQEYVHGKLIE